MTHTIHIKRRRVGVTHPTSEISFAFNAWLIGRIDYGMIMGFWRGDVTLDEVAEEEERQRLVENTVAKIILEKTQPSRTAAVRDNTTGG